MAFNSSGQISYLILDSLSSNSKYGLEIIEYISQKTGGNYILKKPTLYSSLTRMEKKGLISSSYWGESELGGKRHYYTITNEGKRELEALSAEYANANYSEPTSPQPTNENKSTVDTLSQTQESTTSSNAVDEKKPVFLQQDNLFDMVKPTPAKIVETEEKPSSIIENQIDIFSFEASLPKQEEVIKAEEKTVETVTNIAETTNTETQSDDAKFLDEHEKLTPNQEAQNRILYDTSSDLKKYRKRKSFSENQIEMAMVYENAEDREIQKARIEQLKQAMLNSRQNAQANQQPTVPTSQPVFAQQNTSFTKQEIYQQTQTQPEVDETPLTNKKDDAVFITHRIDASEMPIQKKISPTNIEVNIYDDNLPAPKRNSELEPTYKDMMAKLFERKKEKNTQAAPAQPVQKIEEVPVQQQSFSDYNSLKKYYSTHGIEFKEYRKSNVTRHHNTNFLNFINSAILLVLSGIGSAILFGILSAIGLVKAETNFMFYTLPVLFLVYFIYAGIKYKTMPSKKATLVYNAIINWAIALLASVIIFVINVMCGMQFETISAFITTLAVPIYAVLLIFPINYYIKKFIYKKYAK